MYVGQTITCAYCGSKLAGSNMGDDTSSTNQTIAIIGSGLIGRQWSMLFTSVGYNVRIFDIDSKQVTDALDAILVQLRKFEETNLLRGKLSAEEQNSLVKGTSNLSDCLENVIYVQECVPESLDIKKKVFKQLDERATDNMVLASSSSCIMASTFSEDLKHRSQVIVAHPINPPYFVPLVEISPAPWTDPSIVARTRSLMEEIGQSPVTLQKEMPGFALNRIQYAIINESWRLVQDGVLSVEDVDTVMKSGLGPRYVFMGPLETCYLNAEGMLSYCERYGETVYNVSQTSGEIPKMEGATAQLIEDELKKRIPLDKINERRKWRDDRLAELSILKNI